MFNLARQAFVNPFQSAVGSSFQPGAVGSASRCPLCGNAVGIGSTIQPQGFNPLGTGASFGQQAGGSVPTPYAIAQGAGFGQINPLAAQLTGGAFPGSNPMLSQPGTNWPVPAHLAQQGVGGRTGAYGIDPRYAFGQGQQFGHGDPNQVGLNPTIGGDPIGSLLSQQWNQLAQQQLPIRPLIGAQQGLGFQSPVPGFGSPTQFVDPYRMFIEAQLISQLANNPLYQLQRAYGGVPEVTGLGMPFGAGQQFNPLFGTVPYYG